MRRLLVASLALVACSKSSPESRSAGSASGAADPCTPAALGLPKAAPLPRWTPPAGCEATPPQAPTLYGDASLLACKDVGHGLDFGRHRLLAVARTLSPATTGIDALDDGTTITLVSRQVANCPDDPRPMPVPAQLYFLAPAQGDRVFAEATCTVPRACD